MTDDQSLYFSIQEACEYLGCGRTKLYTHYLNQDLLQIKRKIGNRSFILKEDVETLLRNEVSADPTRRIVRDQHSEAVLPDQFPNEASDILLPPKMTTPSESHQKIVTDYISELKQKIHELELKNVEKDQLLSQYKSKLLNTVPLIEYSEKLKIKENEIKEATARLEEQDKKLADIEEQNLQLKNKSNEISKLQDDTYSKLSKSLEVALSYKNRLAIEDQKKQTLKRLQKRWIELTKQLELCGFFEFSQKRRIREEIKLVTANLRTFQ